MALDYCTAKTFGFPITVNIWKDIRNAIFQNGFINLPKFWNDCLSTTFQLLEGPHFIPFPNWKLMEFYYWKYRNTINPLWHHACKTNFNTENMITPSH